MKNRLNAKSGLAKVLGAVLLILPFSNATWAQVPVDENGDVIGQIEARAPNTVTGNEEIPLLSAVDLEELVGPIALYPDDLLAIVLPASAYPLQIVDAARFLEELENDASLEPDSEWDDSVVALINYPEVVELLNEDIDWTWRLGEAVVSQQADVVAAIETFRDRAYAAGNLKSDSYQNVSRDEGVIEITPVADDVIYVPYYEPERVVVYQPRPVYYYYPRPYPVYYYPYPSWYAFDRGYFWGVTTAFTIGWYTDSLNVFHHSYYGHPYYGRSYRDRWWYRRPTINIYNHNYLGRNTTVTVNHYNHGNRWRPRSDRRNYLSDRRLTRNRHYPVRRRNAVNQTDRLPGTTDRQTRTAARRDVPRHSRPRDPITFRERPHKLPPRATGNERTERRNGGNAVREADRREDRAAGSNRRQSTTTRNVPRRSATSAGAATTGSTPTRVHRPRQQAELSRSARVQAKERGSQAAPKLRRAETTARARQTRRAEPLRERRRTETPRQDQAVAQLRRAAPSSGREIRHTTSAPQTRRPEPASAPRARRAEPARQAPPAAAPERRQQTERKAARNSQRRERQEHSGRRQR